MIETTEPLGESLAVFALVGMGWFGANSAALENWYFVSPPVYTRVIMLTRRKMLKSALFISAAAASGAAMLLPKKSNAYYAGPLSDHFDGERFFNPGGRSPKGLQNLATLYFRENWARWPDRVESPFRDVPPPTVGNDHARVSFIGHASWLVQSSGLNILIDPVWSVRASPVRYSGPKRANAPGIMFEDLPKIDVVLVTHNHYDHLDIATLGRIWQRDRPRIVTPLGNDAIMRAGVPGIAVDILDWRQSIALSSTVVAYAETSQHWSARGLRDRRHALWASFVLRTPAGTIYAIGDTGYGDGRTFREVAQRHPKIDLALLPIGAYEPQWFMRDQHMNPSEAVSALELCGARQALGHHWGTFQLTTEPHDQPVRDLSEALIAKGIPASRFGAAQPGQVLTLAG